MHSLTYLHNDVIVGVDTHQDFHVVVALNGLGQEIGSGVFEANAGGYKALLDWARRCGNVRVFGVEGTSCYGAELTRFLFAKDYRIIEVNRPDRAERYSRGKSDEVDARSAARAVLAGTATAIPKVTDQTVEMIRMLKNTRAGAVKSRARVLNEVKSIIVTAPTALRERLHKLSKAKLVATISAFRFQDELTTPIDTAKFSLRCLGQRTQALTQEIKDIDKQLTQLVEATCPNLLRVHGIGIVAAAEIVCAAGENVDRLKSREAFVSLCGVSPVKASSGKTNRHRLNRGGHRGANSVTYTAVLTRMRWDERTKQYVERRIAEGKSKREIIRCLKHYVAREIFTALLADQRHRIQQNSLAKAA